MKDTLPIIPIQNLVLLPNNEISLEFEQISQTLIERIEQYFDNDVVVISQDKSNEDIIFDSLPKIGVSGKIIHKSISASNIVRVVISGRKRVEIDEYIWTDNFIDCVCSEVIDNYDEKENAAMMRKILSETKEYIKTSHYLSEAFFNSLFKINDLDHLTDFMAAKLPITLHRLYGYLYETSSYRRGIMILEDFYMEQDIVNIEREIESKVRKNLDNNQKEFVLREKLKVIKQELGDINIKDDEVELLRERINDLNANEEIKIRLFQELKKYESISSMSPELNISRTYLEWMLSLPWNSITEDNHDLKQVKNSLDGSHYGLDKVKTRIIEYLAVAEKTKSLKSPILCLVGPPGVGKTSLAFSIAKAINRNFVKITVGGVHDEAEIVGHRRTYIGANPGRIIQGMKKAGCANPLFLIDEIDKMSKDYKGDPASALLEILDPEQNQYFSDNYIEEPYDLSKVMFVTTANYIEDIPEALKDRLEIVMLSGYTEYEKLDIAKKHLMNKICENHGISHKDVSISNLVILEVIRSYTKEAGVRELERQLANVVRKIVTELVLTKTKDRQVKVAKEELYKYLGRPKYRTSNNMETKVGVVNGLAYTYYGGDVLPIEVNYFKGTGNLVLTGSLGEVMKESAKIALSYIKSNYSKLNINYDKIVNSDIHIHVPEGAIKKDGPSAGIALTTALVSALSNLKIDKRIAMTGEITLRGNVLPIGGLKEKSIGAYKNNVKMVFIPYDNIPDLEDVPEEIRRKIEYVPVKKYAEVYERLLK
jgi:ATP-dependent Lon protease